MITVVYPLSALSRLARITRLKDFISSMSASSSGALSVNFTILVVLVISK